MVFINVLHLVAQLALVAVFPAIVMRAAQAQSVRRIMISVLAALVFIVIVSAILAAPQFGNRIASNYGYAYTFMRVLAMYGLTLGLPVLAAGIVAAVFVERRTESRVPLVFAYIAALVGWVGGIFTATWFLLA